ncbi:MFS transporter [Leptolyngbya sp. FACHB-711]|uniref:MFS transporter n=1 Tax=unclassified Leptolyngbya TaxID=2650499 RepID=UPI0016878D9A|nr:MFS transporter [Leptolyngbya sp. FACHB-711]MBD1849213.1 MFS transporter [Cyanobacteria bacterium FACHB-502]MBD2025129.1 MFS transporter [Leptolyngbya sp. FACHB-711]
MKSYSPDSLLVKATLLLVSTLTVMAGATIAPSLPAMRQHFSTVPNADYWVRLVLTVPALLIALGAPIAGSIIDRFGRKGLLAAAVFLYGLAGSSGYLLDSLGSILVGRVLLGLSVAGIMTTATTLIADYYLGATRAQFLGLQAAFMGLGGMVFLTLGGYLADVNWRLPFLIYLLAWFIFPLILLVLPEPDRNRSPNQTENLPAEAVPWTVLIMTYGIALMSQIVFYMIPVQLPFYLQQIANANASQSGLAIALATLATSISALSYQRLKARFTFTQLYAIAFLLMGIGYLIISFVSRYNLVLVGLAIAGLGVGLLMPNMNVCLTSSTPVALRGRILGGLTTSFFLGQFISPLISQPLSQQVGLGATYGLAGGLMLGMTLAMLAVMLRWKATPEV